MTEEVGHLRLLGPGDAAQHKIQRGFHVRAIAFGGKSKGLVDLGAFLLVGVSLRLPGSQFQVMPGQCGGVVLLYLAGSEKQLVHERQRFARGWLWRWRWRWRIERGQADGCRGRGRRSEVNAQTGRKVPVDLLGRPVEHLGDHVRPLRLDAPDHRRRQLVPGRIGETQHPAGIHLEVDRAGKLAGGPAR